MQLFHKLAGFLLVLSLILMGCEQQKQIPEEVTGSDPGFQLPETPTERYQAKETVSGCSGGSGSLASAKQAFVSGDFAGCNDQASCAYNASLDVDPQAPDQNAAFYGFLCKLALQIESPAMEYLVLEKLNASDYLMSAGNLSLLADKIETKFPGNDLLFAKNFFTQHQNAGHTVEDVVLKMAEFILGWEDLRILARAMALPPTFENEIPVEFFNTGEAYKVTYTEAGIIYNLIANLQVIAELARLYRVGVESPDSFYSHQDLVDDMNTSPKAFSLRSSEPDTSNLKTRLQEAVRSWALSGANVTAQNFDSTAGEYQVESWVRELYPLNGKEEPYVFIQLFRQVEASMKGKFVWLSASEYGAAVNMEIFLKSPPNADNFNAISIVKLQGVDDIEFDENGMKTLAAEFIRLQTP